MEYKIEWKILNLRWHNLVRPYKALLGSVAVAVAVVVPRALSCSQMLSEVPRGSQRLTARVVVALGGFQRFPEAPRCPQRLPELPKCSQKLPEAPKRSEWLPDVSPGSQRFPDAPRCSQ